VKIQCLIVLITACAILVFAPVALAKPVVIWQWVDDAGKVQYTSNFNSIPEAYRVRVVQGVFIPEKPAKPKNGNSTAKGNQRPKPTNKLETFGERYYEKDGILIVEGKVRNGFAQQISNIKAKVTFMDGDDRFVKVETTFVEPIQLQPSQEGRYKIETPFTPDIASYKSDFSWE
jgi:hypothetical protein